MRTSLIFTSILIGAGVFGELSKTVIPPRSVKLNSPVQAGVLPTTDPTVSDLFFGQYLRVADGRRHMEQGNDPDGCPEVWGKSVLVSCATGSEASAYIQATAVAKRQW